MSVLCFDVTTGFLFTPPLHCGSTSTCSMTPPRCLSSVRPLVTKALRTYWWRNILLFRFVYLLVFAVRQASWVWWWRTARGLTSGSQLLCLLPQAGFSWSLGEDETVALGVFAGRERMERCLWGGQGAHGWASPMTAKTPGRNKWLQLDPLVWHRHEPLSIYSFLNI